MPHNIFSKHIFVLRTWFYFVPRAPEIPTRKFKRVLNTIAKVESSSIHQFWDTPQHFLKTNFYLESRFLLFLELQKSLQVSFQGCWIQLQRVESSSIHHFWGNPQQFLKTHFCLESCFLLFLEIPNHYKKVVKGVEDNGKGLKALAFTVSEISHSIFSKHIFA